MKLRDIPKRISQSEMIKLFYCAVGALLYAYAVNSFVVPAGMYNGGVLGFAQIIRTLLERYAGVSTPFDLAGIISFCLNIPLFLLAYRSVSRPFFFGTILGVTLENVFMTVLPIPKTPLIQDPLTNALIGGLICGYASGLILRNGCSGGGVDILGMFFAKKTNIGVGKISLIANAIVYVICFFLFDKQTVIFSLILTAVYSIALDRTHFQNINCEVIIFSKHNGEEIRDVLMKELHRGITYWKGEGAYTQTSTDVLYTVISKYEVAQLKRIVKTIDPKAFVTVTDGITVAGNYEKHL